MRALIQRVTRAKVSVNGVPVGVIGRGMLVFLGIKKGDTTKNCLELASKLIYLRIFQDDEGKMNRSILDIDGQMLVVSQFTLYGSTVKGNRPSFSDAASAQEAKPLYDFFVLQCKESGIVVETGQFQAQMDVELSNDGPVTLLCCSEND